MTQGKKNALELQSELGRDDGEKGHKKRLGRYANAKANQLSVHDYILQQHSELSREADKLNDCSNFLIFRHWEKQDKYRLIGGCTCKQHLLCAMCALRRSAKNVRKMESKFKGILQELPTLVPVLITITIKNGDDLSERFEHLSSNRKKFMQRRRNALKAKTNRIKNPTVLKDVVGAVGSYEFKKGKGGHGWHPHVHEVAFLEPWVEFKTVTDPKKKENYECPVEFQRKLSEEWKDLTGDSYIVDVRKIDYLKDGQINDDKLLNAICEASKYALKLNDMEHVDQIHAYKTLKCRRLIYSYGVLKGYKEPEDLKDSIEDELALEPYVDLIYKYFNGSYELSEITDTGDTLFSPEAYKSKKKKRSTKAQNSAEERFGHLIDRHIERYQETPV